MNREKIYYYSPGGGLITMFRRRHLVMDKELPEHGNEFISLGSFMNSLETYLTQVLDRAGQSIDGEMKYSVDSKDLSDICRRVETAESPGHQLSRVAAWATDWSPANLKSDVKSLRGEIGRLKYVLLDKTSDRCFRMIEHENEAYIGCLVLG